MGQKPTSPVTARMTPSNAMAFQGVVRKKPTMARPKTTRRTRSTVERLSFMEAPFVNWSLPSATRIPRAYSLERGADFARGSAYRRHRGKGCGHPRPSNPWWLGMAPTQGERYGSSREALKAHVLCHRLWVHAGFRRRAL